MKAVSFYHRETGRLHSSKVIASDDLAVALNTPDDHIAIEGHHDETAFRVNVSTGELVPHSEPAQPVDPTPRIMHLIGMAESRQPRALREFVLGIPGAAERLQEIDAEIAALRAQLPK